MTTEPSEHPKIDRQEFDENSYVVSRLDAYHAMVGKIASEWASIEFYMDYLIWQLAKLEQEAGACITANMIGSGPRLRAIIALLRLRSIPEPTVKKFLSFEGKSQEIQLKRNRAVHDFWAYGGNNQVVQFRIAITKQKLNFGIQAVEFEDLAKTFEEIQHANGVFRLLIGDVFEILPPSPGIGPYIPPRNPLQNLHPEDQEGDT